MDTIDLFGPGLESGRQIHLPGAHLGFFRSGAQQGLTAFQGDDRLFVFRDVGRNTQKSTDGGAARFRIEWRFHLPIDASFTGLGNQLDFLGRMFAAQYAIINAAQTLNGFQGKITAIIAAHQTRSRTLKYFQG